MPKILPAGQHHGKFLAKWSSDSLMVCRLAYRGGARYEEHGNERASVLFVEGGRLLKTFGRKTLSLSRDSMLLIPRSYFQIDKFESNTILLAAEIPERVLTELLGRDVTLRDHVHIADCDVLQFRSRLTRELLQPDELSGLIFQGIFTEILAHAVRKRRRVEYRPASWLHTARELLHDRMLGPLHLREIANAVDVDPGQLSRAFRRSFGMLPGEYLRRLRLEHAAREIEQTTKPLAEIAAGSGFSDQAHLSRVFKQYKGITPSKFRGLGELTITSRAHSSMSVSFP